MQKFLLLVVFFLFIHKVNAQPSGSKVQNINTPLHRFFQSNFDSTIIYATWTSWFPFADYKILAKKEDRVMAFTYKSFFSYDGGHMLPAGLTLKFMREVNNFKSTLPDTNQYFLPAFFQPAMSISVWQKINELLWKLQPDIDTVKSDTPRLINVCNDCQQDDFYLITRKGIEKKEFYALGEMEDNGSTKENRQQALSIVEIFKKLFRSMVR